MTARRHLLVRSGETLCALPLGQVRRVVKAVAVHALPGASAELLGLAEFAGEPLPVLDLGRLVGAVGEPSSGAAVTVVARIGRADPPEIVGLQADEALEILDLAAGATAPRRGLVVGEILNAGRRITMLDLEAWEAA